MKFNQNVICIYVILKPGSLIKWTNIISELINFVTYTRIHEKSEKIQFKYLGRQTDTTEWDDMGTF
jgi:hypothetical protein